MSDDVTLTRQLDDGDPRVGVDFTRLAFQRLATPAALQRVAVIVIALLVLFWPERTELVLERLIGLGLIVTGVGDAVSRPWSRPFVWMRLLVLLVVVGVGGLLVVAPLETSTAIGRVIGALLVGKGLHDVSTVRRVDASERGWRIASASAVAAVGGFVLVFPAALLVITAGALAGLAIATEVIALSMILDPEREVDATMSTATLVREWFADRPKTVDDRQRLYDEVLYDGDQTQTRVVRFAMLMVLSSVIASMGVVSDSTAVLVGAMLIAPLMTPLMAMALSLVMGWPNRLLRSALVALLGVGIAVFTGLVVGVAEFTIIDTAVNSQIVSRANPTVVDLVIAVAAGAAGAYGLSRPDVSNSLPGVAIAIALVPPLTVVGISYSAGDWESGNGALLLFLTNALAIIIVGGLMFLVLGVAPIGRVTENQYRVRTAAATLAGASVLIVAALVLNGTSVATNVLEQRSAQRAVQRWLEPHPLFTTIGTDISGDTVTVVLAGPDSDRRPSADDLADDLSTTLGREITVDVRTRLELRERSSD